MFQKITLIGNLGNDPELRYTPDGTPVANFSVATNRKWTTHNGERKEETLWIKISAWNKLGENCAEYLTKGGQVYIEGRLICDPSTGAPRTFVASDGTVRTSFEVQAYDVKFLSGAGKKQESTQAPIPVIEDEIPF